MAKRKKYKEWQTVDSRIRAALRQLWLRSKERATALRRDKYTCQSCGRKQSKAKGKEFKVEVHHKSGGITWDKLITFIRKELLCNPDNLEVMCHDCHMKQHGKEKK
jgi:5-methylcytosine-specific restriction endonuclease McrA